MADRVQAGPVAAAPPALTVGPAAWLRANLFNTWYNALLTVLIVWALYRILPGIFEWLFTDAVWAAAPSDVCRQAEGACWAFIREKLRFILFGTYPYDEQWRPAVAMLLLVGLVMVSGNRRFWRLELAAAWIVGLVAMFVLMAGEIRFGGVLPFLAMLVGIAVLVGRRGRDDAPLLRPVAVLLATAVFVAWSVFWSFDIVIRIPTGFTPVANSLWGGLPLTLGLSVIGLAAAFPLGIVLALGRRSTMPAIRAICIAYIELIRGVPLITVLFMASVLFPLFLPSGVTIDKLLRAQVGIILFAAAYMAESIRGGLQAIPRGQYEAADSLGLTYWQTTLRVILPQALRISIAPIVNNLISTFKDTSLVVVVGLYDLLNTAKTALTDSAWHGFYREAYIFVGLIYWVCCFWMSRYSQSLERAVNFGVRRQGGTR